MEESGKPNSQKPRKNASWKLFLGAFLLFGSIRSFLTPAQSIPDALKASDPAQQFVMDVTSGIICIVALWLFYSGIRSFRP
jgi:zinc transporter ZupT